MFYWMSPVIKSSLEETPVKLMTFQSLVESPCVFQMVLNALNSWSIFGHVEKILLILQLVFHVSRYLEKAMSTFWVTAKATVVHLMRTSKFL
jgi:hypothetical protein